MQKHKYAYINSKYTYINSKSFSLFFVNHQQRGEKQINNKDIYAIYTHEEEDVKLAPLQHALHEERMTKFELT